mmetsp:Transcript_19346/g.33192  ORF Transcript_19346/g.33192 Transcript_19346/m.33192 type:complete len:146 (+) Transcript_19346:258-695(+)
MDEKRGTGTGNTATNIGKKKKKKKEFDDMYHSMVLHKFVVGAEEEDTDDDAHSKPKGFFPVLDESVQLMVLGLGEEARLSIMSGCGFGSEVQRGYRGTVPADSDLIIHLTILSVTRNGRVHNRKVGGGGVWRWEGGFGSSGFSWI